MISPFPTDRRQARAAQIEALQDWWVDVHCKCARNVTMPIRLMVTRGHRGTLASVLDRLRCSVCGARIFSALLVSNPGPRGELARRQMHGSRGPQELELL